jgi:hypothetical protein
MQRNNRVASQLKIGDRAVAPAHPAGEDLPPAIDKNISKIT